MPAAKPPTSPEPPAALVYGELTDIDVALLCATADGWRPEVGSKVQGTVLAVKTGWSDMNPGKEAPRPYPIVFIIPDGATVADKAVAVHCFQSVIKSEVVTQRPAPGDKWFSQFLGDLGRAARVRGQDPTQYYAVKVTKPDGSSAPMDWTLFNTPGTAA